MKNLIIDGWVCMITSHIKEDWSFKVKAFSDHQSPQTKENGVELWKGIKKFKNLVLLITMFH